MPALGAGADEDGVLRNALVDEVWDDEFTDIDVEHGDLWREDALDVLVGEVDGDDHIASY